MSVEPPYKSNLWSLLFNSLVSFSNPLVDSGPCTMSSHKAIGMLRHNSWQLAPQSRSPVPAL